MALSQVGVDDGTEMVVQANWIPALVNRYAVCKYIINPTDRASRPNDLKFGASIFASSHVQTRMHGQPQIFETRSH